MFTLKYQMKVPLSPLVLTGRLGVFKTLSNAQSTEEQIHSKYCMPSVWFHGVLVESKRESKQSGLPYAAAQAVCSRDSEGMM